MNWSNAATYLNAAPARLALSVAGSGRFVRDRLRGTDYLQLAEVRVHRP